MSATNQVQSTTDYGQFKTLGGNRNVNKQHVNRLVKQIENSGNITEISPITVNERMEVIDGQHRLGAAEKTGVPINYIVRPGLTIEDALQMNITSKTWTPMDYLNLYAQKGIKAYVDAADILENHTWLTVGVLLSIISGSENSGRIRKFKMGELTEFDKDIVEERVQHIEDVARINPIFIQSKMVRAYLSALGTPGFSPERFYNNFKAIGGEFRGQMFWFDNVSIIMSIHNRTVIDVK